ncbi:MAG: hypothetical protein GY696_11560, partial [Gammaproteobacteria bacterium]|nr:hypothetical protein [Gammaproteobacteria bacterium]
MPEFVNASLPLSQAMRLIPPVVFSQKNFPGEVSQAVSKQSTVSTQSSEKEVTVDTSQADPLVRLETEFRDSRIHVANLDLSEQSLLADHSHQSELLPAILDCMRVQRSTTLEMRDLMDTQIGLIRENRLSCATLAANQEQIKQTANLRNSDVTQFLQTVSNTFQGITCAVADLTSAVKQTLDGHVDLSKELTQLKRDFCTQASTNVKISDSSVETEIRDLELRLNEKVKMGFSEIKDLIRDSRKSTVAPCMTVFDEFGRPVQETDGFHPRSGSSPNLVESLCGKGTIPTSNRSCFREYIINEQGRAQSSGSDTVNFLAALGNPEGLINFGSRAPSPIL